MSLIRISQMEKCSCNGVPSSEWNNADLEPACVVFPKTVVKHTKYTLMYDCEGQGVWLNVTKALKLLDIVTFVAPYSRNKEPSNGSIFCLTCDEKLCVKCAYTAGLQARIRFIDDKTTPNLCVDICPTCQESLPPK